MKIPFQPLELFSNTVPVRIQTADPGRRDTCHILADPHAVRSQVASIADLKVQIDAFQKRSIQNTYLHGLVRLGQNRGVHDLNRGHGQAGTHKKPDEKCAECASLHVSLQRGSVMVKDDNLVVN